MNTVPGWNRTLSASAPVKASSEWPANLAFWLFATLVAVFFATLLDSSAIFNGEYVPRSNDSLYHARRILDAAIGERGFYEFDDRLHVPDGTWVPWPWAYDYLIAQSLRLALWLSPGLDPMAFISHIAVVWLGVNVALFLACLHAIGLGTWLRAVALLGFALSPLVQLAHATAMIDHHYMELTFVLLTVWLGLRWLKAGHASRDAALLALALGIAPAFHNGLFILQIPLLGALSLLWVKHQPIAQSSTRVFGATLVVTTLVAALPSQALRAGFFDFSMLSWFHVYVAACSAAVVVYLGMRPFTARNLGVLAVIAVALALPIVAQAIRGAMFFSGDMLLLDDIEEVHSPFKMFFETLGPMETTGYYSWLIVAVPALIVWFGWRLVRENAGPAVLYSTWAVFGLTLMLLQYRFNYFGLLFMISGVLLALDAIARQRQWNPGLVLVGALAGLLVLYQPALRERLFTIYAIGGDRDYQAGFGAFEHLAELCAEHPGTVLANTNDGNAILYHTECSVIANNFIMRPDDERKLAEITELMTGTPNEILEHDPSIDYLLLRVRDFSNLIGDELVLNTRNAIARSFLTDRAPPAGFERTKNLAYIDEAGQEKLYARVFRVNRAPVAELSRAGSPETSN